MLLRYWNLITACLIKPNSWPGSGLCLSFDDPLPSLLTACLPACLPVFALWLHFLDLSAIPLLSNPG